MELSVIIPAYNESRTIEQAIKKIVSVILPAGINKDIILINDGSTDSTIEILSKYAGNPEIRIFNRNITMGKGSAVRLGIEKSRGDIILIQDADLEYSPEDYPGLIEPIIQNRTAIVYGSRFKGNIKNMTLVNRIANLLSNLTLNFFFKTQITDVNTCYKVFKKDALRGLEIVSGGFQFDTEITAKFLKRNYKIIEVPINYSARLKSEGRKMNWLKAIEMYFGLIRYRFKE